VRGRDAAASRTVNDRADDAASAARSEQRRAEALQPLAVARPAATGVARRDRDRRLHRWNPRRHRRRRCRRRRRNGCAGDRRHCDRRLGETTCAWRILAGFEAVACDVATRRGEARIDRRRGVTRRAARGGRRHAASAMARRRRCARFDRLQRGQRAFAFGSVQRIAAARGRGERALTDDERNDENANEAVHAMVQRNAHQSASPAAFAAAFASALPASNSARRRATSSGARRSTLQ